MISASSSRRRRWARCMISACSRYLGEGRHEARGEGWLRQVWRAAPHEAEGGVRHTAHAGTRASPHTNAVPPLSLPPPPPPTPPPAQLRPPLPSGLVRPLAQTRLVRSGATLWRRYRALPRRGGLPMRSSRAPCRRRPAPPPPGSACAGSETGHKGVGARTGGRK